MSSCDPRNLCDEIPQIVQGEKRIITVKILDQNDVGQDMTGVGEIWASFPAKVSGQFVTKKKSDVVDPIEVISGTSNVKITLSPTNTQLLKPAKGQMFFVAIEFPGSLGKKVFRVSSYDVLEAPAFA